MYKASGSRKGRIRLTEMLTLLDKGDTESAGIARGYELGLGPLPVSVSSTSGPSGRFYERRPSAPSKLNKIHLLCNKWRSAPTHSFGARHKRTSLTNHVLRITENRTKIVEKPFAKRPSKICLRRAEVSYSDGRKRLLATTVGRTPWNDLQDIEPHGLGQGPVTIQQKNQLNQACWNLDGQLY